MSWFKLVLYDLRCGLIRLRYLLIPWIVLIPCVQLYRELRSGDLTASCMDYLLHIFKGMEPIQKGDPTDQIQLPMIWLSIIGGSLLINLDYMLHDLTNAGQQIVLRSGTRSGWFLAKSFWNLASTGLYFVLIILTVIVFTIISDGRLSFDNTPEVFLKTFSWINSQPVTLTLVEGVLTSILAPYFTVAALNVLNMTLCLIVKPIIAFFVSMALLVFAVYCNSVCVLGNGAMTIRSNIVAESGHNPLMTICFALIVIVISIVLGIRFFKHTDILSAEE